MPAASAPRHRVPRVTKITGFRLAISCPSRVDGKVVKGENGNAEQDTEWHRVKCFNGLAETVQKHWMKGMNVAVPGAIVAKRKPYAECR